MDIFRLFFMLVFELAQAFLEKSNGSVVGILTSMMDTTGSPRNALWRSLLESKPTWDQQQWYLFLFLVLVFDITRLIWNVNQLLTVKSRSEAAERKVERCDWDSNMSKPADVDWKIRVFPEATLDPWPETKWVLVGWFKGPLFVKAFWIMNILYEHLHFWWGKLSRGRIPMMVV